MPTKRKHPPAPTRRAKSPPSEKLAELLAHAAQHGIKPIVDPDTMRADFWPAGESVDDFVAAVRDLRRRGQ